MEISGAQSPTQIQNQQSIDQAQSNSGSNARSSSNARNNTDLPSFVDPNNNRDFVKEIIRDVVDFGIDYARDKWIKSDRPQAPTSTYGNIPRGPASQLPHPTPLPNPSTTAPTNSAQATDFETTLRNALVADANGNLDEERLQAGLITAALSESSPKLGEAFKASVITAIKNGASVEDAVKASLQSLVQAGAITADVANTIYDTTFRAAQLDNNLSALYDNRGSANDQTVAVLPFEQAIQKSLETLRAIESGTIDTTNSAQDKATADRTGQLGFLWKPRSESDGNLVVLLPSAYSGRLSSAAIYSALPPTPQNLVEEGRFSGDTHNGGRAHYRFDKPGGGYPDGAFVVATLDTGERVSFQIGESSARNE